jgi:hypothetical protein
MGQVTQLLCGEVNLTEQGADGTEVIRPHALQLEPGVCAHTDVREWERRTAHLAGVPYAGRQGDSEWPVHVWVAGSAHGGGNPKYVPEIKVKREDAPLPECEHDSHYACKAVAEKTAPAPLGPHPEPAVSSREGMEGTQYPSAVLKLAERAREAGWEVRRQYARGRTMHGSTGRPLAEKDSYALVFHSHPMTDAGAYAVYRGDAWASVNAGGRVWKGVTLLEQWLLSGGQAVLDVDEAWEQAHEH